jgi:hypothetical protein
MAIDPTPNQPSGAEESPRRERSKPNKTLPTDRITFSKQLTILRSYAAASTTSPNKVVANAQVAGIVEMTAATISLANPFLASIVLLQKTEGGYIPSEEVIGFQRAFEWNPDTAGQKLAEPIRQSWFGQALLSKLSVRSMSEDEALADLASASGASTEYKGQLRVLLDYLATAGLIQNEGGQVRAARSNGQPDRIPQSRPEIKQQEREPTQSKSNVATAFSQTPEGAVNFHITVRVEMKEFANWKPERIAAFFNGIATVLAAEANVEQVGQE